MKLATALQAGRKVLEDHELTQGYFAKDADGKDIYEIAPEAVCFCTLGAVYRGLHNLRVEGLLTEETSFVASRAVQDALEKQIPSHSGIVAWNDVEGRQKAEVLNLFDLAIAEAGDKEIED